MDANRGEPGIGLVLGTYGGQQEVLCGQEIVVCRTPGRLRRGRLGADLIAAGDRVRFRSYGPGLGIIEEVFPRRTQLSRRRSGPGHVATEQVIVANPDQAVFVFSVSAPRPNLRMLDRLLIIASANELPATICANKVDLLERPDQAQELFGIYKQIGYPVLYTSAVTGLGLAELRECLANRVSVLCGPSATGKSSLMNAIQPGLRLATRELSSSTGKGRHTTVSVRLWPLDGGGFVADTPGLREVGFFQIDPEELAWHFPEMRPYLGDCHFSSCSHTHEAGCAVVAAVESGAISRSRHDSYCRLRVPWRQPERVRSQGTASGKGAASGV